ncbi:MAG TPA: CopG family antitoxin [Xanthobacteraceae bacterium]|nr:CopG family antitoxin [Xanthobacteraceae bacterium]
MKRVPKLRTDEAAEVFLEQDLSGLDFSQFKPARFEFQPKTERVNMRLSKPLLESVKKLATRQGISYQRLIRQVLERAVTTTKR